MDSLTQIVLGAAVGEVLLGRKLGNKAILLGAIGGTVPDMDVFYNLIDNDPIQQLIVHRGYSHSVITHVFLALPFAWVSSKWNKSKITFKKWYLFWFLCFFTHALLDCCTTYGTKLFTPISNYQVAFNNISVIDPLYTIPFLLLLSICLFFKRESEIRRNFLIAAITYSSLYMVLTFGLKYKVDRIFKASLQNNNIEYIELNTTPTILNSILWCAIAYNDSVLYLAEYSFLNTKIPITWVPYERNLEELKKFDSEKLKTVEWFSDGNYFVVPTAADTIELYNVKFGRMNFDSSKPNEAFVFYFQFYKDGEDIKYKEIRPLEFTFSKAFNQLTKRIGL